MAFPPWDPGPCPCGSLAGRGPQEETPALGTQAWLPAFWGSDRGPASWTQTPTASSPTCLPPLGTGSCRGSILALHTTNPHRNASSGRTSGLQFLAAAPLCPVSVSGLVVSAFLFLSGHFNCMWKEVEPVPWSQGSLPVVTCPHSSSWLAVLPHPHTLHPAGSSCLLGRPPVPPLLSPRRLSPRWLCSQLPSPAQGRSCSRNLCGHLMCARLPLCPHSPLPGWRKGKGDLWAEGHSQPPGSSLSAHPRRPKTGQGLPSQAGAGDVALLQPHLLPQRPMQPQLLCPQGCECIPLTEQVRRTLRAGPCGRRGQVSGHSSHHPAGMRGAPGLWLQGPCPASGKGVPGS